MQKKSHPWRMCPGGQYWVSEHPRRVSVSKKNPTGITIVDGHCRTNPSKKDQIYSDEIHAIADKYFFEVTDLPTPDKLGQSNGNDYDRIIAGWTQYWNEVLSPEISLDPNVVKALISTESDFHEKSKNRVSKGNFARGLMQITDETIDILKSERGELKDFLVNIDQKEAFDPNLNICAGIRWLFHKKKLLEHKLSRKASWEEATMGYKSYTKKLKKGEKKALGQKEKFLKLYERLRKWKKN